MKLLSTNETFNFKKKMKLDIKHRVKKELEINLYDVDKLCYNRRIKLLNAKGNSCLSCKATKDEYR